MSCNEFDDDERDVSVMRQTSKKFICALGEKLNGVVWCGRSPEGFPIYVQPVKCEEQEVFCQNCFETIMMNDVNQHSLSCTTKDIDFL